MSKKYREFIKTFPCVACNATSLTKAIDPHHLRLKGAGGMGMKPPDSYCIPLCHEHHQEIHAKGRLTFFTKYFTFITKETLDEFLYKALFKYLSIFCGEIERA